MKAIRNRRVLRVLWWGHGFWWRRSGGRIGGNIRGLPVLELITTGRTTGQPRSVLLSFVHHPRGFVVAASNAGADTSPSWWLNLLASPVAEVNMPDGSHAVVAKELEGAERDDAWTGFADANPDYTTYAALTARPIAVVLLAVTARDPGPGRQERDG